MKETFRLLLKCAGSLAQCGAELIHPGGLGGSSLEVHHKIVPLILLLKSLPNSLGVRKSEKASEISTYCGGFQGILLM